ncbi:MAG: flagellar protein FliS [Sinobacteraceae bacterium]|nr:flagellar protein FliS [Nevskiaceae bacterium]
MLLPQNPALSRASGGTLQWRPRAPYGVDLRLLGMALELLAGAEECLERAADQHAAAHIAAAVATIGEFRADLDLHIANPVTAHLDDLCEYVIRLLGLAQRQCRREPLLEVYGLLHEVRAAWVTLSHV